MPQIIISNNARNHLKKIYDFLEKSDKESAKEAIKTIKQGLHYLKKMPLMGRILEENKSLNELIIKYGNSGYIVLYHYNEIIDQVVILAIKHQKELDY
jgi:plasmid stabilization system protein ParE